MPETAKPKAAKKGKSRPSFSAPVFTTEARAAGWVDVAPAPPPERPAKAPGRNPFVGRPARLSFFACPLFESSNEFFLATETFHNRRPLSPPSPSSPSSRPWGICRAIAIAASGKLYF